MMQHVNLRLSDEQLEVIERYRASLEREGLRVTRSDAIRALLLGAYPYRRIAEDLQAEREASGRKDQAAE
ncbi:hypothetical protein D3C81_2157380 [compost metagenome]